MRSFEDSEKTIESEIENSHDSESWSESKKAVEPEEPELTSFLDIYQQLNISRDTAYNRISYLRIKPWKKGKRLFLDREQVGYMKDLHNYHQKTGGFSGFPIPEPTGPWEETQPLEEKPELESGLAIREEVTMEQPPRPSTTASPTSVEVEEDVQATLEEVVQQKKLATAADDLKELHEKSQNRAASRTLIHETLTLLYESTEQYTIEGLKEKVEAHKERCRAARRGGDAAMQDLFNQSLRSLLPNRKNDSTQ